MPVDKEESATIENLYNVVRHYPLVDNHAHNLLLPDHLNDHPFEVISTEANGVALEDTPYSLSHIRAARHLSEFYDCEADWNAVKSVRNDMLAKHSSNHNVIRRCFEGIHSILMDDGLDSDTVEPYDWHNQFIEGSTHRVVRIEKEAETIARRMTKGKTPADLSDPYDLFTAFEGFFETAIERAIRDETVVAFKSVICYRTGLRISNAYAENLAKDFDTYLLKAVRTGDFRIENENINNYIVNCTVNLLSESARRKPPKPIQFHTGIGDKDIDLLLSDPSFLQQTIEEHPDVKFVILHAAYPYTREAGYLASVYKNVYMDIGEVFPMLSRDGQESVLRQCLELVPWNKILWSTDGHWFPETYWIANKQFREALEEVLFTGISKGDYSIAQAMEIAMKIMFHNADELYELRLPRPSLSYTITTFAPNPDRTSEEVYNVRHLNNFLASNPLVKFIWVQWLEYNSLLRVRMMPVKEFRNLLASGNRIGISAGNMFTLADDSLLPGESPVGQILVEPDIGSIRPNTKQHANSATVMSFWRSDSGSPLRGCPRTELSKMLEESAVYEINFLVGFEIEVIFLSLPDLEPLSSNHAWSTLSSSQRTLLPLIYEIVSTLSTVGISVGQFHAESAPGQYEFILPPQAPLQAVDTLLQARQIIAYVAESHNLRATFHPRPIPGAAGTACHAHISFSPPPLQRHFIAGVLAHLPSICAFTLPSSASYARIRSGIWAGGEWVTWGTQNRECPIRKVTDGRYEIRCLDGLANPYLALAAIIGAGLTGLRNKIPLAMGDCRTNPSELSDTERQVLGITKKMPTSIEESLDALSGDGELLKVLGTEWVRKYVKMKRFNEEKFGSKDEEEMRRWIIERW